MISILIPVYNTDVRKLVSALAEQAKDQSSVSEIIVLDDGSDSAVCRLNAAVASHLVQYHLSGANHGRIQARKKLASLASNNWLLFLDDDSGIIRNGFLQTYCSAIPDPHTVVAGGRSYAEEKPPCAFRLHWLYGRSREGRWMQAANDFRGFQSNNFLVYRPVFEAIRFPEALSGYGHEDTWMGMQLENMGCRMQKIDNPVVHQGLQRQEQFLAKAEEALNNLPVLRRSAGDRQLAAHVKIFRAYRRLERWRLLTALQWLCAVCKGYIHRNIHSCTPSLRLFDLYRLGYLAKIFR